MSDVKIVDSNGTLAWSPSGLVYMDSGDIVTYRVDKENNKVTVDCSVPKGYKQKWYSDIVECVSKHAASVLTPAGSPVSVDFRHLDSVAIEENGETRYEVVPVDSQQNPDGYYVASMNGIPPLEGSLDIVGGGTFRWAPASSGLSIADVARPDVDCLDYMKLAGYVTRIEEAMDAIAAELGGVPAESGGVASKYGLFKQWQALREMWNYLVIRNMVVFNAQYQGDHAFIKARLTNTSAYQIPVGNLTIGFSVQQGSAAANLEALFESAYSFDSAGNALTWTTPSAKRQPMRTGSWTVAPPSSVTVEPGSFIELSIRYSLYGVIDTSVPPQVNLTKRDTPWVGQWPETSGSLVTKPGHLSWFNTHFNPQSYGATTPPGLPPVGDGCLNRFSPGTASAAWGSIQPSSHVVRPGIYVGLTCTKDGNTSSLSTDFEDVVETDEDDPTGTYSISRTATTASLVFTPTSGSASTILTITLGNRHFHEGDGISVNIPKGWSDSFASIVGSGLSVPVACLWDIPANLLIQQNSQAGGTKNLLIPSDASSSRILKKRITLDSQLYAVDSVRTPYYFVSVTEEIT